MEGYESLFASVIVLSVLCGITLAFLAIIIQLYAKRWGLVWYSVCVSIYTVILIVVWLVVRKTVGYIGHCNIDLIAIMALVLLTLLALVEIKHPRIGPYLRIIRLRHKYMY